MKRKIFYIILSFFIIILVSIVFISWPASPNKITLKIGYNVESVNHAPVVIAYEAGIFTKHKLNVELVPLKSGKEVQQALAIGKIDMGSTAPTTFFISVAKGAPIKIIAPSTISPSIIFVRPDSNIKTLNDLVGKTIASQTVGSSHLALALILKKNNISLDSIKFIDIEGTLRPIALMEQKIVDAAEASKFQEKIYQDYGAVVLEEWETKNLINKTFPQTVIAVNSNFMAKNKKMTELFIDSFIESQKFIKDNPDEAAKIIAKHIERGSGGAINFSVEDIKETWKETKYILWSEPSDFVEISKMSEKMGDIKSALTLDQIFDLSFEEKLKNAQNEIYSTH